MSEIPEQHGSEPNRGPVVMKFGGTSVENAEAIQRLIRIVESRLAEDERPVIVVSALAGVTDQLVEAGSEAAQGHLGSALALVRKIHVRHEQLVDELVSGEAQAVLEREIRTQAQGLESLLGGVAEARQLTAATQDQLLGSGECLSSRVIAAALCGAGVTAHPVDSRACIVTDDRHGQAGPLWEITRERVRLALFPLLALECVPVMGGYIGATVDGVPTTLGRGGSDFSAAIVGEALHASRVEIWTDVDGIMTTDPKLCADARVIHQMSFDEASELAHFGAKVLHPATLLPAMRKNIPVYVLNSRRPEGKGTEILADAISSGGIVSAITAKRKIAAVEIEAAGAFNADLLQAIFAAFDRHACPVDVMGASLGRMSVLVGSIAELPGVAADLKGLVSVRWENHKALICLVGENLQRQPEVASQVFAAVADMEIRVICQNASDRTISFLVEEERVEESVQRLHRLFFSRREPAADWGEASNAYCQVG
jgi:aspartate kinase